MHTAPSSCELKAGTVVPPLNLVPPQSFKIDTEWFPGIGALRHLCLWCWPEGLCLRNIFLLDGISVAVHLLEPPHPAPFTEHMKTLELQLERFGAFLHTAASCVGNPGKPFIISAGFGQDGNFCVTMQTVTTKTCIIYTAYSHITFNRFLSKGSMQKASLHLEFLTMFCCCSI